MSGAGEPKSNAMPSPSLAKSFSSTIEHGIRDSGLGIRAKGELPKARHNPPPPRSAAIKPRSPGAQRRGEQRSPCLLL